ncbi:MAG: 30S ribosome-binding factor RbfA [Lewinellaceae bacterium]|nr:30S ribosome-binding factor RbfA [Lewinellaceae bacterium]
METIKQKQVAELVKRHFSQVLQSEGTYIFGATPLVTVTAVKMTPDMGLAKIYLSVFNTENKQAVILEMEEERTRLRQSLGVRLRRHVRRLPEIDFYLDDTLDEMYRLNDLFQQLHANDQMGKADEEE